MTQIVSSISGLQVYAPSAGFAPTNSADVSAIASGYQVVSSTSTELYAGTAFLTGVNGAPVSASRAGNAANAGMANSAYYDGTGRLISSLPDSAAVSGIASAYAESAASGKQDTLSFSYDDDKISAINGSALAGGITGDYLTSKVGSGQATFSTAFQDGLAKRPSLVIAAERTAGVNIYPRMMVTDWNDTTGDTHSGVLLSNAFEFYRCPTSAKGEVDPSGFVAARLDADSYEMGVNDGVSSKTRSAYYGRSGMHIGYSGDTASWVKVTGDTYYGGLISLDNRNGIHGVIYPSSIGYWNGKLDGSASSSFYTTANESSYVDSAYVESQVSGVIGTVSSNSASWSGGVDSATVSAIASAYAESAASGKQRSGDYISAVKFKQAIYKTTSNASQYIMFGGPPENTTSNAKAGIWLSGEFGTAYYKDNELNLNRNNMKIAFNIGGAGPKISSMATGTLHSYMYLFASGNNSGTYSDTGIKFKDSGSNTVALYDSATYGNITSVYDTVSSNSATWGQGGVDSATVSAIASAYQVVSSLGGDNSYVTSINSKYISATHAFNAELAKKVLTGAAATSTAYISSLGGIDSATCSAIASAYAESSVSAVSGKQDSSAMTAYVDKSAYDELYSSYTGLSALVSQYSGWFNELSSISAKVDNSAIGVV